MLITCPTCAAGYDVPDHALEQHVQTLRCTHCTTEWSVAGSDASQREQGGAPAPFSLPPGQPLMADPSSHTRPAPMSAASMSAASVVAEAAPPIGEQNGRNQDGRALLAGGAASSLGSTKKNPPSLATLLVAWAVSLLLVGAAGGAAYHWRSSVVTFWPPSQSVFLALGVR